MKNSLPLIKLLLVEDDEDDYVLTRDMLRASALFTFELDWAQSVEQARAWLSKNVHDICLMDYRLGPDVGLNLVREAGTLGFTAPIVMLTGQEDAGVESEAAEAGAVDYLLKKTLSTEQLQRTIRYALSRREIDRERFERLRAESANRSKTEFMATLSHEIRTPLTAVLGFTELLLNQCTDDSIYNSLAIIDRNGKHLLSLLNDTLDLTKIEAGKLEIEKGPIEFWLFLADIYALNKISAQEKGIRFTIDLPSELPQVIYSDATRLRQILLNLLGNAIKFTNVGEVQLAVEIEQRKGKRFLLFHVKDSGPGIAQDDIERIFTPFYQIATPEKFRKGTGLGLTISHRLAEKLGGSVTVSCSSSAGTTFTLCIDPGDLNDATIAVVDMDITSWAVPLLNALPELPGKVLVVDDVEDIGRLIENILITAGAKSDYAVNGRQALDMLNAAPEEYALIIMDLNMPVMTGYEALTAIRESGNQIPVIALTAASLQGENEKCLAMGFSHFLSKPIRASMLISVIANTFPQTLYARKLQSTKEGKKLIVVVEDDPDANHATCMLLELLGANVIPAFSVKEALAHCHTHRPDLIFTDLNLPDGDGITLAAKLNEINPHGSVVLLTGESIELGKSLPPNIDSWLLKPLSLADLRKELDDLDLRV